MYTWRSMEPLPTNPTIPEVNPWDVVSSEPVESTGKKEMSNTTVENKMETPLGSKVTVEAIGAGDVKIEDTVDSTASYIETNINHQNTESSLYSGCTADKNANPSEIVDSSVIPPIYITYIYELQRNQVRRKHKECGTCDYYGTK
ncbi:hypothetical protein E2986_12123 [Frieseomelitta varia]|uniref:Uncharacterized protein n=1 Tax=Frieseomelitta varia TaxID=561572 RepID=A0A833VQ13_9HYME|nr:hypothetical protein E2986_12123 [Frieseomelitta varia]